MEPIEYEGEGYDVIIVGAGVVGSALGYALGNDGRKVLVLERDLSEPDRIVGELLQPGGVQKLQDLGLSDCLNNIDAIEVHGYGVFWQGRGVKLPYPRDSKGSIIMGRSFHHGRFISALRNALKTAKSAELRQGTVLSLLEEGAQVAGVAYRDSNHNSHDVRAKLTIVCDGCFSNFRKKFIEEKPVATSSFVGVIIKDTELPFPNHGHVILTNPGPILAYQIGTSEARMLVDIPLPLPSSSNGDLQKYLIDVTAPQLPDSLRSAFIDAVQSDRPRSMPNSKLHPHSTIRPGVLLLGDAFNMRHPLTGGGMSVGLSDAVIVRNILRKVGDLSDTDHVVTSLQELYVIRKPLASTVNILASALYSVFIASDDPVLPHMRRACLTYFQLGGIAVSGPVSLLSALKPRPLVLLFHFFLVAFVGILQVLWPFPTPKKIYTAYKLLSAAANIVVPLIKAEQVLPLVPIICSFLRLTKSQDPTTSLIPPDQSQYK